MVMHLTWSTTFESMPTKILVSLTPAHVPLIIWHNKGGRQSSLW